MSVLQPLGAGAVELPDNNTIIVRCAAEKQKRLHDFIGGNTLANSGAINTNVRTCPPLLLACINCPALGSGPERAQSFFTSSIFGIVAQRRGIC